MPRKHASLCVVVGPSRTAVLCGAPGARLATAASTRRAPASPPHSHAQTTQGRRIPGSFRCTNYMVYFHPKKSATPRDFRHIPLSFFRIPLGLIERCVHGTLALDATHPLPRLVLHSLYKAVCGACACG